MIGAESTAIVVHETFACGSSPEIDDWISLLLRPSGFVTLLVRVELSLVHYDTHSRHHVRGRASFHPLQHTQKEEDEEEVEKTTLFTW